MGVPIEIAAPGPDASSTRSRLPLAQPLDDGRARRPAEGARRERRVPRRARPRRSSLHTAATSRRPASSSPGSGARGRVDADALRTAARGHAQALARVGGTLGWLLDESLPLPLPDQARGPRRGNDPRRLRAGPLEDAGRREASTPDRAHRHRPRRDAGAARGRRARRAARRAHEPRARPREHAAERAQPAHARRARAGARRRARPPEGGGARAARARQARHGRALRRRPRQPQRAAPDRPALRAAGTRRTRTCISASSARRSRSTRAGSR